jgi:hypothetical protein
MTFRAGRLRTTRPADLHQRAAAYEQLCQLFDAETNNGADMTRYNKLLDGAVESIAKTFQKRVARRPSIGAGLRDSERAGASARNDRL